MRFVPSPQALLVACLLPIAAVGCSSGGDASDDDATDDSTASSTGQQLFVDTNAIWSTPKSIPVCWTNPTNTQAMQWVQEAAAATWSAHAPVTFTGWGTCGAADPNTPEVRIQIADQAAPLGPRADIGPVAGQDVTMWLNFTFDNWSPSCKSTLQYCIQAIAVHEFGHVLGFDHEQNRPDDPVNTCPQDTNIAGNRELGPYDPSSVMNYCNRNWNNNGALSAGDIAGVQAIYGVPPTQPTPPPAPGCGLFGSGKTLTTGQSVKSCHGKYELILQTDGNLVLYHLGVSAIWNTQTSGKGADRLAMQGDGNLVLYAGSKSVWNSKTATDKGASLAVQDDGNVVLYVAGPKVVWQTKTAGR